MDRKILSEKFREAYMNGDGRNQKEYFELLIKARTNYIEKAKQKATISSILIYAIIIFLSLFFGSGYDLKVLECAAISLVGGAVFLYLSVLVHLFTFSGIEQREKDLRELKEKYIKDCLEPGEIPFWEYE